MTGLETGPGCPASSLFGLAPGGVCRAVPVARSAVRSYRTLSPLPAFAFRLRRGRPGGLSRYSCGAAEAGGLLSVALSLGSPPAAVSRHRISMEPGHSSPEGAATRSTGGRYVRGIVTVVL